VQFEELLKYFERLLGQSKGLLGLFEGLLMQSEELSGQFAGLLGIFEGLSVQFEGLLWQFEGLLGQSERLLGLFEGLLLPVMTDKEPTPNEILEIIHCNCKTGCNTKRCTCRLHGLDCN